MICKYLNSTVNMQGQINLLVGQVENRLGPYWHPEVSVPLQDGASRLGYDTGLQLNSNLTPPDPCFSD